MVYYSNQDNLHDLRKMKVYTRYEDMKGCTINQKVREERELQYNKTIKILISKAIEVVWLDW